MTARSRDVPRYPKPKIAAAALLAALTFAGGALAQDPSGQSASGSASTATKPAAPEPRDLEPLNAYEATGVLGRKVVGPNGEALGLIGDVIVDRDGRPRAAVIDFGGFLGVGSRKIAVDWNLLQFEPGPRDQKVVLALDRREIQGAPEYRADADSAAMLGPPLVGPSTRGNGGE